MSRKWWAEMRRVWCCCCSRKTGKPVICCLEVIILKFTGGVAVRATHRDRLTNGPTGSRVRVTVCLSDRLRDWLTASQETSRINQSRLTDWLTKGQQKEEGKKKKSCRQTERNKCCERRPGRVNSRRGDTVGWWPGGGGIEGKRWGVKRTGCNTEGCWGGEMRGLNCWCKRGHTPFFFLPRAHTHAIAHTALTSCFYPREVIQGSGVQMKTNNSGRTYCSSPPWLFLLLFSRCSRDQAFPFHLPSAVLLSPGSIPLLHPHPFLLSHPRLWISHSSL